MALWNRVPAPMSEFKFACPVCGQHITADARASGTQLECPTCFQKIVVPQAPASPDPKFILSATQVSKPRPGLSDTAGGPAPLRRSLGSRFMSALLGLVFVALAAGAAVFAFKRHLFRLGGPEARAETNSPAHRPAAPPHAYPVPTEFGWSLDLTNLTCPETAPAGRIHGSGFRCERVIIQGGNLSFRQGRTWPPDLGLTLLLFAKGPEQLSGKTIEVSAERTPPLPRLILRWKDDQLHAAKKEFRSGYALKLSFGHPANGRLPGQIFVCLPDESKSFMAGTFAAEIRRPPPPKPRRPRTPPRPQALPGH